MSPESREPSRGGALKCVFQTPALRRVELSWGLSKIAYWSWIVTMNMVAYKEGGAWAVGLVVAFHNIPGAIFTPFASVFAQRLGGTRALELFAWVRGGAMLASAIAIGAGSPLWVLVLIASAEGLGSEPHDAVQLPLLPWLARTAEELTAANSVTEALRMAGMLLGPVMATILLWLSGADTALYFCGGTGVIAALLLRGLGRSVMGEGTPETEKVHKTLLVGLRSLLGDRDKAVLLSLCSFLALGVAALQVYATGLSIDVLDLGDSGPPILFAFLGLGGLLGGVGSLGLVGQRNLAIPFVCGAGLVAAGMAGIGLFMNRMAAFSSMTLIGVGLVIFMVAGTTLMQRGIPLKLQAALFGLSALVGNIAYGLGAFAAPALVTSLGLELSVIATGAAMFGATVLGLPSMRRFAAQTDAHRREVEVARHSPILGVLPLAPLERVAAALQRFELEAGEPAVRQGDPGEHFFIVSRGRLSVLVDGERVNELRDGDAFGEIALLRDVPRTASVIALEPSEVYRLDRENFLTALNVSPESHRLAHELSDQRFEVSSGENP